MCVNWNRSITTSIERTSASHGKPLPGSRLQNPSTFHNGRCSADAAFLLGCRPAPCFKKQLPLQQQHQQHTTTPTTNNNNKIPYAQATLCFPFFLKQRHSLPQQPQ